MLPMRSSSAEVRVFLATLRNGRDIAPYRCLRLRGLSPGDVVAALKRVGRPPQRG